MARVIYTEMLLWWLNYGLHNVQRCHINEIGQVSTNYSGLDVMKFFLNDEIVQDWAKVFKIVFKLFSVFSLYPDVGHLASPYIYNSC